MTYEELRGCLVTGFSLSAEAINTLFAVIIYTDDPEENIYISLGGDDAAGEIEGLVGADFDLADYIIDIMPNPELEALSIFFDHSSSEDEF